MRAIATPQYQRIVDDLRQAIYSGVLAPGQQVPTLATLREQYGVANATAAKAHEQLLREGLTVSKPGAGSWVRERPAVTRMVRSWYQQPGTGSPWRAEMAAVRRDGSWRSSSSPTAAPPAVAERLRIEAGARVMRTAYTFLLDGEPTYLSVSWEPLAITGGTEVMLPESGPHAGKGVWDRMALIGHVPTRVTEEVAPRTLTEAEAAELVLHAGIAILEVQRTYWQDDLPLETADVVLPPHYRAVYEIPLG
ncbi:MAG TPA: GntR family transcriptional regulator [Trebonia sp.]